MPRMSTKTIKLSEIAFARSGDKGSGANVGIAAYTPDGYDVMLEVLTADKVKEFFSSMGVREVKRYEMPILGAFNFTLAEILDGGGSRSLRIDAQGKALGQALLEMDIEIPEARYKDCLPLDKR